MIRRPGLVRLVSTAFIAGLVATSVGACRERARSATDHERIEAIEEIYREVRAIRDQIDITRSRGATGTQDGILLGELIESYSRLRADLERALAGASEPPRSEEDARAIAAMRHALAVYLMEEKPSAQPAASVPGSAARVACEYDPQSIAHGEGGYEALSERIYACFSEAARSLSFEGERLDRLTIFGRLSLSEDRATREGLWRAMNPIWAAVNGDNGPRSPYRTLIRLNAARLKRAGEALGQSVHGIGIEPDVMEQWLVRVLEKWREIAPAESIEPWDFSYNAGRANRALSAAIPVESLRPINDRFYSDLGADPVALQVQYDLEPRSSKDPVAFATFGRRPRFDGQRWVLGEPWVFASYRMGGLDNLLELLHETGHAIHIAAIRTRPAFMDWPDSDIFTEGVADIATLEMYEPAWQQRYLGASVPIEDAIVAKYAAIVMDIAWALFEVRMHRAPERDPNAVWSAICATYFRIRVHDDVAWWAVRGQLIGSPGYMMNYAAGAIMNADLRARARELVGPYTEGNPHWYRAISEHLYRFGLAKSSRDVIESFLGRPVSPRALLDDMERAIAAAR